MIGPLTGMVPLKTNIDIGTHTQGTFLGMTFNLDTIWTTGVAGLIIIVLGFVVRWRLTRPVVDHVPSKLQLMWEGIVKEVNTQVEDNLGQVHPYVAPLAIALFFFILVANWLEVIPSQPNNGPHSIHLLPAPTSDANLTYAMALLSMVSVWVFALRKQGIKNVVKHFFEPIKILAPLNLIEEAVKPVTLALRLFGNIFAGGLMVSLIGLLPIYTVWAGDVVWKLFDMFIGAIQAFIFALLVVIYFGMWSHAPEHEEEQPRQAPTDDTDEPEAQPELAA
ncbi:MAG: F0F1 ATP synthase subunit A [Marmoricola sp.]